MPGIFRRVWEKRKERVVSRHELRENARKYKKTRKERKELQRKLVAGYVPKKVKRAKRELIPRDYFYIARAEAKRQRRARRRVREALHWGWGSDGYDASLRYLETHPEAVVD